MRDLCVLFWCVCVCMDVCIFMCVYIDMFMRVYICVYVCIYVFVFVCAREICGWRISQYLLLALLGPVKAFYTWDILHGVVP